MGSCFSAPEPSPRRRRRHTRSQPRCVPVQYEFYYSTRGDETVLVREPIEESQPQCQPRCPQHCETTVSVSMNVSPPTELGDRHREDADRKRRSLKKKKSSRHKKKKKRHRSRRSSRQYTETEADSAWTGDDENHYQVALWIGESSRVHGGTNSPEEGGSGAREAAEDEYNVSSPDGEDVDETQDFKQPKRS
ncbi:hypothetical protein GGI35DRAFT_242364 [Trichoderma velutinum]